MKSRAVHATGVVLLLTATSSLAQAPLTVSPGSATGVVIGNACPTFSWGEVDGAKSYELVVYRVENEGVEAQPVLRRSFPGSVDGWTPALDQCLERGQRYAWSLRAVVRNESSDWSAPSLFEVAAGPTVEELEVALEVVRLYLEEGASGEGDGSMRGAPPGLLPSVPVSPSTGESTAEPSRHTEGGGDPDLQVNGAPVVTTATLGAQLCLAFDYRFLDLGDGTVLDCNTERIWLKDASCLGPASWDGTGGSSIFTQVTALNNGTDFSCEGYPPGTHTDWEVPLMTALCGLWPPGCSEPPCCTASQGIVDTSFHAPAVPNAAGDGQWMPEDAFVGELNVSYWSANQGSPTEAWYVFLRTGTVSRHEKAHSFYVWPVRDAP